MNIEAGFSQGNFAVIEIREDDTVIRKAIMSQSERSDVLRELLAAAEVLANPSTPLAALLAGSLSVAGALETEAAR